MFADPARLREQIVVLAILSIIQVAAIAIPTYAQAPWLIYNASGSAPLGFYRVDHHLPSRGDMAVIRPLATVANLLANRGLLPPGVPLLKRVVAAGGDQICRSNGVVFVNGKVIAEALDRGSDGLPLPFWEGCVQLFEGQFFVIQPYPYSFDSRYFGPVSECQIMGIAHPIWTWDPTD
jgi:conjugative transfer signal peptidase TraF